MSPVTKQHTTNSTFSDRGSALEHTENKKRKGECLGTEEGNSTLQTLSCRVLTSSASSVLTHLQLEDGRVDDLGPVALEAGDDGFEGPLTDGHLLGPKIPRALG